MKSHTWAKLFPIDKHVFHYIIIDAKDCCESPIQLRSTLIEETAWLKFEQKRVFGEWHSSCWNRLSVKGFTIVGIDLRRLVDQQTLRVNGWSRGEREPDELCKRSNGWEKRSSNESNCQSERARRVSVLWLDRDLPLDPALQSGMKNREKREWSKEKEAVSKSFFLIFQFALCSNSHTSCASRLCRGLSSCFTFLH